MSKYINAETAEKSLRQYAEQKHANGEIELANGILKAVCRLKTIPTADVKEVVRGKWVQINNTQEHYCSECGVAFNLYQYCKADYNLCPSCGADLREDKLCN